MSAITVNTEQMRDVGDHILAEIQDDKMILVIDLSSPIGESKSGKSMGYASTAGITRLVGGYIGNVWIGKKGNGN